MKHLLSFLLVALLSACSQIPLRSNKHYFSKEFDLGTNAVVSGQVHGATAGYYNFYVTFSGVEKAQISTNNFAPQLPTKLTVSVSTNGGKALDSQVTELTFAYYNASKHEVCYSVTGFTAAEDANIEFSLRDDTSDSRRKTRLDLVRLVAK